MGEKMKAYVMVGPKESEIRQIEWFQPDPGEVVVRTEAAAICTTERRVFAGALKIPYPVIGGHEISGTVAEVNDPDSDLKPGDRVVVDAVGRCGGCHYCVTGFSNLCVRAYSRGRNGYRVVGGGFAEYVTISAKRLFRVSGDVPFKEAALTEPVACCLRSLQRARLGFGETVAVVGVGTMGTLHVLLAQKMGARVVAVDLDPDRLELARKLGATHALNPTRGDVAASIQSFTEGRGADVVFVAASTLGAGQSALDLVGKTGRVVFFASIHPPENLSVPWNLLHHKEVSLIGTVGKTENDFRRAAAMLSSGALDVSPIISRTIGIEQLDDELSSTPAGDAYRVVVVHSEHQGVH